MKKEYNFLKAERGEFFRKGIKIGRRRMISPKKQMTKIIQEEPDDISYEEIFDELVFAHMVERGLADSKAKRTVANDEVKRKIK